MWQGLIQISRSISDEPWMVMGDFNAVLDDSEVSGNAADTSASMAEFSECITDSELHHLPFTGANFTWHNCSDGERSLWKRLDRMLVKKLGWLNGLSPSILVRILERLIIPRSSYRAKIVDKKPLCSDLRIT
ncbi:UNVERIFIED_CONTAM: hypothetical protein Scaly_3052000 [Sesamum calycinum]|uniref:Endonuclease/exonuclease/phosphatase domain-containing protein n=1 Tax=Sesamum calycinum TaxID=2727403 RepID=A0AAW2K170_9LAMI